MRLRCPSCGSRSCVNPAEYAIKAAPTLYAKCASCNDLVLDKRAQIDPPNTSFDDLRCTNCGRRPLDAVMAHILSLSGGQESRPALTLRQVGTPLLCPGVPTYAPPHIGYQNLLLLTKQQIIADASDLILKHVSEVKGVIYGDTKRVIGLTDRDAAPYTCRVSAGCDMRADLVTSAYGQILVHKSQSKIHIEHDNMAKMAKLGTLPVAGRVVLDALAGPGTLGLMSVLMGAQKVILNDAWLPAVENAYLNLQANREILGIRMLRRASVKKRARSKAPYLYCIATTDHTVIELYHGEFEEFNIYDSKAHLILLDSFPNAERYFIDMAEEIRKRYPGINVVCI
jgi:DNA-directed RNA polymerase subunit RPC12/RpoP